MARGEGRAAALSRRDPTQFLRRLQGEKIHRASAVELHAIDVAIVSALAARLDRRTAFALTVSDRELYVSIGNETISGAVVRHVLAD